MQLSQKAASYHPEACYSAKDTSEEKTQDALLCTDSIASEKAVSAAYKGLLPHYNFILYKKGRSVFISTH